METDTYTPHVRWAQRREFIYLKVDIDGATDIVVKMEGKKMAVSANGSNGRHYEINMDFFAEVDKEASTWVQQPLYIEMKVYKKETSEYWDRLLSESGKRHWLSVDWAKWKDEDESDEELNLAGNQQGFGGFDFGNMGGEEEDDDDDEDDEMPGLE